MDLHFPLQHREHNTFRKLEQLQNNALLIPEKQILKT